ncbi:NAD(P)H-dependent oxidoreductase [Streptomyces antibioticus]|uniref:NAD(P)H-dependent oxidoreductase n=1 Tax=Streptomyces antibioticus TaxID=1890 RepID=UPI0033C1221A
MPREPAPLHVHSTVVLQFPFYWYSTPPLLKQWLDQVTPYGPALPASRTTKVMDAAVEGACRALDDL